jgi:hypothetical protein
MALAAIVIVEFAVIVELYRQRCRLRRPLQQSSSSTTDAQKPAAQVFARGRLDWR